MWLDPRCHYGAQWVLFLSRLCGHPKCLNFSLQGVWGLMGNLWR